MPEMDLEDILIGDRPSLDALDAWIGSPTGELWTASRCFDLIADADDGNGELLCAVGLLLKLERRDAQRQLERSSRRPSRLRRAWGRLRG